MKVKYFVLAISLLFVILLINIVSAAPPAENTCAIKQNIDSECPNSMVVIGLSAETNAHAQTQNIATSGVDEHPYALCCNFGSFDPRICGSSNEHVLVRLASPFSNSHIDVTGTDPTYSSLSCYEHLTYRYDQTQDCNTANGEFELFSLSGMTNAHAAQPGFNRATYPIRICAIAATVTTCPLGNVDCTATNQVCSVQGELDSCCSGACQSPTKTCQEAGGFQCEPGEVCREGTSVPANDIPPVCCQPGTPPNPLDYNCVPSTNPCQGITCDDFDGTDRTSCTENECVTCFWNNGDCSETENPNVELCSDYIVNECAGFANPVALNSVLIDITSPPDPLIASSDFDCDTSNEVADSLGNKFRIENCKCLRVNSKGQQDPSGNYCGHDFDATPIDDGGNPISLDCGSCSYSELKTDTCDQQGGLLEILFKGFWNDPISSDSITTPPLECYQCPNKENVIPCPSAVLLPFFNSATFIITAISIILIYLIILRKKRKETKRVK